MQKSLLFLSILTLCWVIASASADEVHLGPGQTITIGNTQVSCGGSPSGSEKEIVSSVDSSCLEALYQMISGRPTAQRTVQWAQACRSVLVHQQACYVLSSEPDTSCYNTIYQMVSGIPTPDEITQMTASCRKVTLRCQVPDTGIERASQVDENCLDRMDASVTGRPTAVQAVSFAHQCRSFIPSGAFCVVTSGKYDASCGQKLFNMIVGRPSADEATQFGAACRSLTASCQ